jgi:hypothetical protein
LLDRTYRPGGWTARQVEHHVADSHTNAYVRTKWMLTENLPTIKAYDEKAWALTPETTLDPAISLDVLKSLHCKWVSLLRGLPLSDFMRRFVHPETGKEVILDRMVDMYSWHGKHHCGHIQLVLEMK